MFQTEQKACWNFDAPYRDHQVQLHRSYLRLLITCHDETDSGACLSQSRSCFPLPRVGLWDLNFFFLLLLLPMNLRFLCKTSMAGALTSTMGVLIVLPVLFPARRCFAPTVTRWTPRASCYASHSRWFPTPPLRSLFSSSLSAQEPKGAYGETKARTSLIFAWFKKKERKYLIRVMEIFWKLWPKPSFFLLI